MIVREENDQLVCVTQREHARLSQVLYETYSPEPQETVAAAVRHHDDGWAETDESPDVDSGSVVDYRSIPLPEHLGILRRSVTRCADRHPYAGWLVSQHGCSFHEGKSGEAVEEFLQEQAQKRRGLAESIEAALMEHAERDFDWLQFTDAVSLFVLDPWSERLEWKRGTPGEVVLREVSATEFVLETSAPLDDVVLKYSYRSVPAKSTDSARALRDHLTRAETQTDEIRLRRV